MDEFSAWVICLPVRRPRRREGRRNSGVGCLQSSSGQGFHKATLKFMVFVWSAGHAFSGLIDQDGALAHQARTEL